MKHGKDVINVHTFMPPQKHTHTHKQKQIQKKTLQHIQTIQRKAVYPVCNIGLKYCVAQARCTGTKHSCVLEMSIKLAWQGSVPFKSRAQLKFVPFSEQKKKIKIPML